MPITIPSNFREQIEKEKADSPFYWLWQIWGHDGTGGAEGLLFQVVNAPADVSWNTMVFNSFPIMQTPVREDGSGSFQYTDVSVDNSSRILMPYLQGVTGVRAFLGMPAFAWLVNKSDLSASKYVRFDFEVQSWAASPEIITFRMAAPNMLLKQVPIDRFNTNICSHKFGNLASGCPYIVNTFAAFATCNQTLADCNARGADHAARGVPVLMPLYFGGFPGVGIDRDAA